MLWRFGPDTTIVVGAGAARPTERAAAYVQVEVERRTGWRWEIRRGGEAGARCVVLGVPGDGSPASPLMPRYAEEIALWCGADPADAPAFALAGGPGVAMAAAGAFVRALDLRPGAAAVPAMSRREHPAYPVRGHTFASHQQNNTHDKWEWHHWEEYLTELAAWGNNTAILYPLHAERWQGVLPFGDGDGDDGTPWFADADHEREWHRQWDIQTRLPALCQELGMRYGLWLPVNDVFPEEVLRHREITKQGGAYVCPHIPEGRRRIRALRERIFAALPHIDILVLPSRDDGGCPNCDDCAPWGRTYRELVGEQAEHLRRHHPGAMIWPGLQGLDPGEAHLMLEWLDRDRPDYVEGVEFGPYSELMAYGTPDAPGGTLSIVPYRRAGVIAGPAARLRAALPGQYRLVLYPDVSHTMRCQYPVRGMDDAVQYVWNREDGPSFRPREYAAMHRATAPVSDGSVPYTEGNHDDCNKFLWSALDWDPDTTPEQFAADYARWFFGPVVAPDATRLILLYEEALGVPIYGNAQVAECRALMDACERAAPELADNWRWLLLRVGVLMLAYLQRVQRRDRDEAATLRYRVPSGSNFDAAPFLRAGVAYVEGLFAEDLAPLAEIVWTRDRLYDRQKLAIRGVARLQHSTMGLDVLVRTWRDVLARLERGELTDPVERVRVLTGAAWGFEDGQKNATRGIALTEYTQEMPWQRGIPKWKFEST